MVGEILKSTVAGAFRLALGRRNLVRFSRFLLNRARLDLTNDMDRNGELMVQRVVLDLPGPGGASTVFDVGANVGRWSERLLRLAAERDAQVRLHAFEPSSATFARLEQTIGALAAKGRVTLVNQALSDRAGSSTLYGPGELAGTNSLYSQLHDRDSRLAESVRVATVDEYCASAGVERITLLKVDAEGHDLPVLHGASGMLDAGRIDCAQFEYTWRWIAARRFLKDVFDLLEDKDYRLGKITPRGIEFYRRWDPELETFNEANYLLVRSDLAGRFPSIRWWKEPP